MFYAGRKSESLFVLNSMLLWHPCPTSVILQKVDAAFQCDIHLRSPLHVVKLLSHLETFACDLTWRLTRTLIDQLFRFQTSSFTRHSGSKLRIFTVFRWTWWESCIRTAVRRFSCRFVKVWSFGSLLLPFLPSIFPVDTFSHFLTSLFVLQIIRPRGSFPHFDVVLFNRALVVYLLMETAHYNGIPKTATVQRTQVGVQ